MRPRIRIARSGFGMTRVVERPGTDRPARTKSWNPIMLLPRRWRMTEAEELTIETMTGMASRRLKVFANASRFNDGVFPIVLDSRGHVEQLIAAFDANRERWKERR